MLTLAQVLGEAYVPMSLFILGFMIPIKTLTCSTISTSLQILQLGFPNIFFFSFLFYFRLTQGIYENSSFFPIDGLGWNDYCNDSSSPPKPHNFAFCTQIHFRAAYSGGEYIQIASTDDAWVYINGMFFVNYFLKSFHM